MDLAVDAANQTEMREAGAIKVLARLSAGTDEQSAYASLVLTKLQESAASLPTTSIDLASAEASLRAIRDASATPTDPTLNTTSGAREQTHHESVIPSVRVDANITREGAAATLRVATIGFDIQALTAALDRAQIEGIDDSLLEAGVMRLSLLENAVGASGGPPESEAGGDGSSREGAVQRASSMRRQLVRLPTHCAAYRRRMRPWRRRCVRSGRSGRRSGRLQYR